MPAGRPPHYETPEALQSKVDEYFEWIKGVPYNAVDAMTTGRDYLRNPEPPTITGMCLFLGFESRQSFADYKEKPEFTYAVKKARMRIECEYEKALTTAKNPAGSIFALKNLDWSDKQSVETDGKMEVTVKYEKRDSNTPTASQQSGQD